MRQHRWEDERIDAVEAGAAREDASGLVRSPAPALEQLQRSVGNQAVLRYLRSGPRSRHVGRVRAKDILLDEGDTYEVKLKSFREFEKKGREYYASMVKAITNLDAVDKNMTAEFDERYESKSQPNSTVPSNVNTNVQDPSGFTQVDTSKKGGETAYKNYVSGDEHTLVASWNYANKDEGGPGKRLPHSEVLLRQYTEFGGPLKELTTIIRSSIQGPVANDLIDMCRGKRGEKVAGITFTPEDEDFYALLASDNGKAVAFMLTDHPNESGRKTITSIKMYKDRLVLTLGQL